MSGVLLTSGVANFCPAIAVPMTVKMPDPMTAPIPSAVSDHGPRDFFSACSGSSDSRISLSMDLQASSWLGSAVLLVPCGGGLLKGYRVLLRGGAGEGSFKPSAVSFQRLRVPAKVLQVPDEPKAES